MEKLPLKSESVRIVSSPSAAQNLDKAKGKSLEILITIVFSSDAVSWLNLLADAEHIPVSILGNKYNTNFFH